VWVERGEAAPNPECPKFGVEFGDGLADLLALFVVAVFAGGGVGHVEIGAGGHQLLLVSGLTPSSLQ
jgi:hypothetical protein